MATHESLARVERWAWILIYGGLLTLVLGLAARSSHVAAGWSLIVVGGLIAAAGPVLIYVRSRMRKPAAPESS